MNPKSTVIGLAGAVLIVVAGVLAVNRFSFLANAKEASGQVVETPFGGSHPRIEFSLPDGKAVAYSQGGLIFGYQVGDKVSVSYDPADPQGSACLKSFGAQWGTIASLALLGLALVIMSLF